MRIFPFVVEITGKRRNLQVTVRKWMGLGLLAIVVWGAFIAMIMADKG